MPDHSRSQSVTARCEDSTSVGLRVLAIAVAMITALIARPCAGASQEQIETAIRRGVNYLYSTQNQHGNWEKTQTHPGVTGNKADEGQWGGVTALVVYALLAAGEKPLDERIVRATDWLREAPITGHYALGVRANVWLNLPPTDANRKALMKDARLLLDGISKDGHNKGFYDYQPGGPRLDISCSQFGVLGAWAAAQRLEEFPDAYWQMVDAAWRNQQAENGAWSYGGKPKPIPGGFDAATIQMTAAGVATLYITQEFLYAKVGLEGNRGNIVDPSIERGMAWITAELPALIKDPKNYGLYGIERIGLASGYKYIGKIDWFAEGAEALVRTQNATSGAWVEDINTSLAVLFLSRGRAPVMANKLQYYASPDKKDRRKQAHWNQRPRDVANATRYVEQVTERKLNWQILDFDVISIRDLHDSKLLWITGDAALEFTDAEKATLKQYVEEGGLVVGNADVGKSQFARSFRQLGQELFPLYEFAQLQPTHPLMNNQQFKSAEWKRRPRVEAMGNGARAYMVLLPNDDFSRTLQARDLNRTEVFQFMANLYLYSVDKTQPAYKGQTHVVRADPTIKPDREIGIARIKYTGNWDPEPAGWRRLASVMHNQSRVALKVEAVEASDQALAGHRIAHLTGTGAFQLKPEERDAMKAFLEKGGLLIVDAAGGSADFDTSVRRELQAMLPAGARTELPIPETDPLFANKVGERLKPQLRVFAQQKLGARGPQFQLAGTYIDEKLAVIYSPYDLSVGLVGHAVDGVDGFEPKVATELMRRILLMREDGKL